MNISAAPGSGSNSSSSATAPFSAPIDVSGIDVVVLGGGLGAHRVVPSLVDAGASVTIVAADVRATLEELPGGVRVHRDTWSDSVLEGAGLLVVTGDEPAIEGAEAGAFPEAIGAAVRSARIPVARADAELRDGGDGGVGVAEELKGTVALVGGGPGDDGMLTLRGRELLMQADVIIADRLAPQRVLADVPAGTEIIDAAKIPYGRQMAQQAINEAMIEHAKAGKFVVRFKGGDNFLFGRGYEEALALAEHSIPTFVVPGVTSAFAGPALGGVTVTHRGVTHEVTVISGHVPPGHEKSLVNWPAVAAMRGTVVLLMAVKNGPAIADALIEGGRPADTPVSIIESASLSTERRVDATLASLREVMAAENVVPPAIIVIGEVAGLPQVLAPDRF